MESDELDKVAMIERIVEQVFLAQELTPEVANQIDAMMWTPDLSKQDLEALQNLLRAIAAGIVKCVAPLSAQSCLA